ncbi:N-6 DNA methylase [Pseudomonas aeruginosa]|uniref:N-6 DNA methylase n=1 Tax=Pseudomonas aeruginosa TaxID=287 RepID=UPI0015DAFF27|nr:N-6 DNA methylase [Pseudomonas aeruginosa]MDG9820339.1 type I restriction-modification system subunit M [Pseudomonas aeruginosa]MDG9931481.1 type I restriction-modification system subunit M [Pseudomonas aeruginosa]MDH0527582.1 type I restriction-modification system subunit M [Pseudomonas aeruginosa]MDH0534805.1 type I restriction-modification system subunit M [Pseudomonas aeruginosa]WKA37344.1 N-6 DNA methylase [Pseudomonas aeruginosa]
MNLSSTIKSIQDIMRKDDGVDGDAQRLGQLTWMLFLKIFDQREEEWEDDNPKYKSPLPKRMRWRNWAAYVPGRDGKKKPQIAASEVISFVNNDLFPSLKDLNANASPQHKVIRSVFEDANNYMKSGPQFLAVIEKLEEAIDFHDFKTRANLGDVYEQLLNDLRGAGNAGEFYTPRAITQFMVDRVNPRLKKNEVVLDPACGTGGFLTATIDHLRNQRTTKSGTKEQRAIEAAIRGIEKKQLPHLLCTTNMLLHGIDVPSQIEHRNTLGVGWNEWSANDKVDCVITNPPFGGYEDDGVGSDYPADLRTRETADMFMALIIKKLLKENGRAAVVLPDGFLFGDGIKATLKRLLLRDCKLHTIVRLPKGVFAPYTTIKTNLLFFTKGALVDDGTEHFHTDTIWYYEHPYPPGYKSYSKTKPIRFEEFRPEQDWWGNEANDFADRVENEFAWRVDFKTKREQAEAFAKPHWDRAEQLGNEASALDNRIRDLRDSIKGVSDAKQRQPVEAEIDALRTQADTLRLQARDAQAAGERLYWPIYNLDLKNPNAPEEESHDPDVLMEKYKVLLGQIEETENSLKSELAAALAHHFVGEDA